MNVTMLHPEFYSSHPICVYVCSIHVSDVANINFYVVSVYLQCCNGASDEKFPIGRMGASGAD